MRISLLVLGHPTSSHSAHTALEFAKAALAQKYHIHRVFFYHDAVYTADSLLTPGQDEPNIALQWQAFGKANEIDMVICIASALKRGVINKNEAKRHNKQTHNLLEGFDLSGLGQFVDSTIRSDRIITFGC